MSEQQFCCTVDWEKEWNPDSKDPTSWYAATRVNVYNLGSQKADLRESKITFHFLRDLKISNIYGLQWPPTMTEEKLTSSLVEERGTIEPHGRQFFSLGLDNGGKKLPDKPSSLLFDFSIDGISAPIPLDHEPPSTPKNLQGIPGPTFVYVAWDASTDNLAVSHYLVYVNDSDPVRANIPSCIVTGLLPSTTYHIKVQAVDIAGNTSGFSEPVEVMTTKPLPDCGDWDIRGAPFVDLTANPTPRVPGDYTKDTGLKGFFLGFGVVTTDPSDTVLKWGGNKEMPDPESGDFLPADLAQGTWDKPDLETFTKSGGKFAISFGGASNYPLEIHETNVEKIVSQYEDIIKNYQCWHFDFDFEDGILEPQNASALERHVVAMVELLRKQPELKISYTLQVDGAPGILVGFNPNGERLLSLLAKLGIQPSLITGMLMEFNQSAPPKTWDCCKAALDGMHDKIKKSWPEWNDAKVWRRIGACPMFGKHNNGRIFTLDDMDTLLVFAKENNLGCLTGWDATRDHNQGRPGMCPLPDPPLFQCTGIEQNPFDFCKKIATYTPVR